jgi:ribosomal protein S18 acetylase RimI-like enzyme
MAIRTAVLEHGRLEVAARVVIVQQAAYRVEAELIGFDGIPPLRELADDVSRLDLTVLGALDGDDLAGIVGYRRRAEAVDIDRLAVDPSHFRRGIGTLLVEEVHRREASARRFEVSTGAANAPAVALYLRLGYRRVDDKVLPEGVTIAQFVRP